MLESILRDQEIRHLMRSYYDTALESLVHTLKEGRAGSNFEREVFKVSKYMQVDIRIIPFYEKRFEKRFPNIAELLRQMSHKDLVEREISFYEMADYLETITDNPGTPSDVRDKLGPYAEKIMELKEIAREHLLSRRLNEMDQVLYEMEDQFVDLEEVL